MRNYFEVKLKLLCKNYYLPLQGQFSEKNGLNPQISRESKSVPQPAGLSPVGKLLRK